MSFPQQFHGVFLLHFILLLFFIPYLSMAQSCSVIISVTCLLTFALCLPPVKSPPRIFVFTFHPSFPKLYFLIGILALFPNEMTHHIPNLVVVKVFVISLHYFDCLSISILSHFYLYLVFSH